MGNFDLVSFVTGGGVGGIANQGLEVARPDLDEVEVLPTGDVRSAPRGWRAAPGAASATSADTDVAHGAVAL